MKNGALVFHRASYFEIFTGPLLGGSMRGATAPSIRTKIEDNDIYPQPQK